MRPSTALLVLLLALSASLSASPPQEPEVKISFTNTPLTEVLKLYQNLKDKRIMVSEPLRQKLVSISSEELVTRGDAIKLIESSLLDNYGIRIEQNYGMWVAHPETGGWIRIEHSDAISLDVLGPNEEGGDKTPLLPLVHEKVIMCPPRRLPSQEIRRLPPQEIPTGGLSGETGGQSGAPIKETPDLKLMLSAACNDFQRAEGMLREGQRNEAKEAFSRVLGQLDQIKTQAPTLQPLLVDLRLKKTRKYLDSLTDSEQ
jgi:hypothetical protein